MMIAVYITAALALIYLILIAPRPRRDGFPFEDGEFAHRGLHGAGVPENSAAAFRRAAARGCGAELDVQLTSDGRAVVFHDATTGRVCGTDLEIVKTPLAALRELSLCGTDEKIPLFEEALEALDGVPLICEIKVSPGADIPALCKTACDALEKYRGPFCVESFHPAALRWFRKNRPQIIRGQLSRNMMKHRDHPSAPVRFIMTNLLTNFYTRPDFIAYDYTDAKTAGYVLCASLFRPFTAAWTPRGAAGIDKARSLGFDAVIFEEE